MKINRLNLSVAIQADKTDIWHALWDDANYREWTKVFFEGSYAVPADNWKEGSQVMFLAPDKNGMYSHIETHIPNEKIEFKHIGSVVEGKPQPIDEDTKKWSDTTECYYITEGTDHNTLTIDIDVMEEHLEVMNRTLVLALEKVKEMAERA